jgi:RNA polymerase sigma-70 factor (sigma-E family)
VHEVTRGSPDLEKLFTERYPSLCRIAAALLGDRNDAEQVVMDAFVEATRRWDEIDEPERYVQRAVLNGAYSGLRRRRLEVAKNELFLVWREAPPEAPVDQWVAGQPVIAAVRGLPTRQRAVVVLFYFEDLTVEDVARALGVTVGAVKNRLFEARRTLAQRLGSDFRDT